MGDCKTKPCYTSPMTIPSPCISICSIDEQTGFCKGCKRTVAEVAMWLYLSDEQKAGVIKELKERKLSSSSCA